MASKKITKKTTAAVATTSKNTAVGEAFDYSQYAGKSMEDIGQDEAGMPFLKILQAQSPEVIGPQGKIEGAGAGLLMNTATQELSESIRFAPAIRQHVFVEWRPRKEGGGIVNVHAVNSPIVAAAKAASTEFGKYKTEAGNDLVETFYVFGHVLDADNNVTGGIVVPFSSTGIKKYKKQFISRIRMFTVNGVNPPMFAHTVVITSETETNDSGTWSNYKIAFANDNNVEASLLPVDSGAFQAGAKLAEDVSAGLVKADTEKADRGDGAEAKDGASAF